MEIINSNKNDNHDNDRIYTFKVKVVTSYNGTSGTQYLDYELKVKS